MKRAMSNIIDLIAVIIISIAGAFIGLWEEDQDA